MYAIRSYYAPPAWLNLDSDFDATNLNNWVVGDADPNNDTAAVADIDNRTRYTVVYEGSYNFV